MVPISPLDAKAYFSGQNPTAGSACKPNYAASIGASGCARSSGEPNETGPFPGIAFSEQLALIDKGGNPHQQHRIADLYVRLGIVAHRVADDASDLPPFGCRPLQ